MGAPAVLEDLATESVEALEDLATLAKSEAGLRTKGASEASEVLAKESAATPEDPVTRAKSEVGL